MGSNAARDRARMVQEQLRRRGIADDRVLAAMSAVPRERFVGKEVLRLAYSDAAIPIGGGQTISQPYMVALMTQLLAPRKGSRILELGTGSGYQSAVLAAMGAWVTSIERFPDLAAAARKRLESLGLADRVNILVADGSLGDPAGVLYDGIIVTAAAPSIPDELREQLHDGGRLVIPVGSRDLQSLMLVVRHGNEWIETSHGNCVFVPLVGPGGFPG